MDVFLANTLLSYIQQLKIFFKFFKRKEKNGVTVKFGRKWQIKKVEKIEMNMYKEIEKRVIKEVVDCGVLN